MEKIESYLKTLQTEIEIKSQDYSSYIQLSENSEIDSNYPSHIEGINIYNIEKKPFERVIAKIKL